MDRQDFRQILSRLCSLALLAGGMLAPSGCAQQEGDLAFRRFWGFEPNGNHAADRFAGENVGGLIPKLLGHDPNKPDLAQDPFLAQGFGSSDKSQSKATGSTDAKTSLATAQTLFDAPPIDSLEATEEQSDATEGNPFRLVQHQAPVSEVSSTEKRPPTSPATPPQNANGPSQIDRLKIALSRDAQTPAPSRPQAEASEVNRQRVEAMMKTARRQIQLGEYESALRWATAAEELARRAELFFGPEEDPPADLVRSLEDRLKVPPTGTERPVPMPEMPVVVQANPQTTPGTPTLSIEFPEGEAPQRNNPFENLSPEDVDGPSSLPHSTQAMTQAVIAPETLTQSAEELGSTPGSPVQLPVGTHAGSTSGEPARVGVNQGAVVSVEGPLDPPMETLLPQVPLAPPAMEASQLPPFAMAMTEPVRSLPRSELPPPLSPSSAPPRAAIATSPQAAPSGFSPEETDQPAPTTLKNVDWEETDEVEPAKKQEWWMLPACFLAGVAVAGALLLKRKRA